MHLSVLALTTDSIKSAALTSVLVLVVVFVVAALVIKAVVTKVITMAVCALLILGLMSQRASITSCVERLKKDPVTTECSFFGFKVKVPLDQLRP